MFVKAKQNYPGGDSKYNGGVFFNLLLTSPDVDLLAPNPDGQPYEYRPDPWQPTTTNPLYNLWKQEDNLERDRFLGSYALNWDITSALKFNGEYSFENTNRINTAYSPYDTYTLSSGETQFIQKDLITSTLLNYFLKEHKPTCSIQIILET